MTAYYNEYDPKAAAWLRELIKQGHIADGVVDDRSIEDVTPNDLKGFTQCHFFAGIGVWSYALRRAGWADDRPVWTGSCPCQPFSGAGKGAGFADERHLWPAFYHLIRECSPTIILGEQVAAKDGLAWLDLVSSDLENAGYANGAVDLCAAGVGAPHIRQRLWWVGARLADTSVEGLQGGERIWEARTQGSPSGHRAECGGADGLADTSKSRRSAGGVNGRIDEPEADQRGQDSGDAQPSGLYDGLADAAPPRRGERGTNNDQSSKMADDEQRRDASHITRCGAHIGRPGSANGFWRNADWLFCRDNKFRPVEPGTSPLVDGAPARVGRLRGYGNAICAQAAQAFIESVM